MDPSLPPEPPANRNSETNGSSHTLQGGTLGGRPIPEQRSKGCFDLSGVAQGHPGSVTQEVSSGLASQTEDPSQVWLLYAGRMLSERFLFWHNNILSVKFRLSQACLESSVYVTLCFQHLGLLSLASLLLVK